MLLVIGSVIRKTIKISSTITAFASVVLLGGCLQSAQKQNPDPVISHSGTNTTYIVNNQLVSKEPAPSDSQDDSEIEDVWSHIRDSKKTR